MSSISKAEALAAVRRSIDETDTQLLRLLNSRAQLSLEVGRIKHDGKENGDALIYDPKRERTLLDRLISENGGPLTEAHIKVLWSEIFSVSRALQHPRSVAYLGPEGTFSYFAGVEFLGRSTRFCPCSHFEEIFRRVQDGSCDLGVIPLENSLQGTVGQNFDLLWRYEVDFRAEFLSRISHSLMSLEHEIGRIQKIYSHPQPLAQCGRWLHDNCPNALLVPVESTAAAADRAAEEPGSAAIGRDSLADRLGLNTLAKCIEDDPANWTRFVLIGRRGMESAFSRGGADKSSLMFTLPDKSGALAMVLNELSLAGVNMRKLESRPLRGTCWKYIFFCDVECDLYEDKFSELRTRLMEKCLSFRILGSYPSGMKTGLEDIGAPQ
ncbi:MAG: prephenate dehydratase [Desulfovibrionaceae bacterium]|nr:prephenate dehydratase [Desulfovibrionaceae bacterium]